MNAHFRLGNDPEYGLIDVNAQIRGRGNCTWTDYPKKPFKIKLEEKKSIHGFPSDKDWVLLAEYTDRSLIRTAWMLEISRAIKMPYTVNYQYCDLFLNDEYQGTYIITEQIEKSKERVNISEDGFLIEDDGYYMNEPLFFTSSNFGFNYTFKYPKPSAAGIVQYDEKYNYILNYVDSLEDTLLSDSFKDPVNGYRQYIDIDTFAKWFLIQEIIGNWDCNVFYVVPSKGSKLYMYPCWDAEWSLGLANRTGGYWNPPSAGSPVDAKIWPTRKYFSRLLEDPAFVDELKHNWDEILPLLPSLNNKVSAVAESIRYSQKSNFEKWQTLGKFVRVEVVTFDTWEENVEYVQNFLEARIDYIDTWIKSL